MATAVTSCKSSDSWSKVSGMMLCLHSWAVLPAVPTGGPVLFTDSLAAPSGPHLKAILGTAGPVVIHHVLVLQPTDRPGCIVLPHPSGVGTVTANSCSRQERTSLLRFCQAHEDAPCPQSELSSLFTFEFVAWSVGSSEHFPSPESLSTQAILRRDYAGRHRTPQ